MTAADSKPSASPDKPEATETTEPVKRPRGRPRKTPVTEPVSEKPKKAASAAPKKAVSTAPKKAASAAPKKAASAASKKPVAKRASSAKTVHVPRDQPSEWIVERDDDIGAKKPASPPRASAVKPIDKETVRHVADEISDEISDAEIRARREAARAVVADIGRMKEDVKSMNSYIAAPPPEVVAERQDEDGGSGEEGSPLSRREYWKQRRQERYLQRQQRRQSSPSDSGTSDHPSRASNRQDRSRPRPNQRSRPDQSHGESSTKSTETLPPLKVSDLQALASEALLSMADEQKIVDTLASYAKHDVVFALLRNYAIRGGSVIGEGVLEICQEGHGFLRNPWASFRSCPEDAMVPLQMIRKFSLRPGDCISGVTRPPSRDQRERRFVVIDVVLVNGIEPVTSLRAPFFDSLEVVHPDRQIRLETTAEEVEMRVLDLFTPIGFGQRGLILAPSRTGRRVLFRKLANAIKENHPEVELMILLIDDRPEEVTDMGRKTNAKIFSSTFDEAPASHVQTAEVTLDLARRSAERGKNVVVLLDSLTRLAKAYNALEPHGGRVLQGGFDVNAILRTKQLFSAARNLEAGGSLTLIATVPIQAGNCEGNVVFEEFQDAANTVVCLDRQLAEKAIYPALDIAKSGTRHAEQLLAPEALKKIAALRTMLEASSAEEAMQDVLKRMAGAADNEKLLVQVKS